MYVYSADDAVDSYITTPTISNLTSSLPSPSSNQVIRSIMEQYEGSTEGDVREQDRLLPIANIARIMKKVLPNNGKVSKEGKEVVQECVSEFISFITSEASERCVHEKRKTINGDDVIWAMNTLGFDAYVEPMAVYLGKYRESIKLEMPEKRQKTGRPRAESNQESGTEVSAEAPAPATEGEKATI